jgi:hypothetical protein
MGVDGDENRRVRRTDSEAEAVTGEALLRGRCSFARGGETCVFHGRPQVCSGPIAMLTLSSVPKIVRSVSVSAHCLRVPGSFPGWQERFLRKGQGVRRAGVAQLVEHLICNQRVGGSNPFASSTQ